MRVPLYLSKRKAKKCIYVPVKITEHLHLHHIDIVRFIYRSYLKKINVVLNVDNTTNKPLQICAFMSAVKPFPALLIIPDDDIEDWYREIQIKTQFSTSILTDPKETILGLDDVTLVGHDKLKRMTNLKTIKWALFLIDGIEEVIKVGCIKKIDAKFNIAATNYDFIRTPNYQLQKDILKWLKYKEKISKHFTLLNSEFWLRKSQGNQKRANDAQQSGVESKNESNPKKTAVKNNSANKPKDTIECNKIIENPFPDSPIDFDFMTEELQTSLEKNNEKNEHISDSLDDNKLIENSKKNSEQKSKSKYKKIIENNFPESQEDDNVPEAPMKYSNLDKPSTSGLNQKNGVKKQKFNFDDKPYKKHKRDKYENNDINTNDVKSLENQTQFVCTTESDRVLAEVLDINSQILDVEDVLTKNTPIISKSPLSWVKSNVKEMEPDPILDALFFSSYKNGDQDNKMTTEDDKVKSLIQSEHEDAMQNEIKKDVERSSICGSTETEKLLDMLFSF